MSILSRREDDLDPAHLAVSQPDLDAVGMKGGFGQDILDNASGQSSGALVFFQHDINLYSGFYIPAIFPIH